MPPEPSETFVALGPDLFVALDGRIVRNAPFAAPIIQTDPDPVFGGTPILTPIGPLTGGQPSHPPEVWNNIKTATELAEHVKELAEHGLKTVGGIASIVGTVGVVLELLESAGIFGSKTTLDDVLRVATANFTATIAASQISHLQNMVPYVTKAAVALDKVEQFRTHPNLRQDLADLDSDMQEATLALTDSAFQQVVFNLNEYGTFPWWFEQDWLTIPEHVEAKVPRPDLAIRRFPEIANGAARFDYRFALGNIIFTVTTRVMMMHALEPEFRSTGGHRQELETLCSRLKDLQWRWLQAFQWPWHPSDDEPPPITPLSASPWGSYVPVGAVDTCSGVSFWITRYVPKWDPYAPVTEPEYWASPTSMPGNWPEDVRNKYHQRARTLSEAARQTVMEQSGYLAYAAFVASICKLTTDPSQSETVVIRRQQQSVAAFDFRWGRESTLDKIIGGLFCTRQTFTAEVWRRPDASTRVEIRTQTPESIATWAIKYEYLLLTGAGEVALLPGTQTATINAPRFIAEVGPAGEWREVEAEPAWANTAIEYTLNVTPGHTSLTLKVESPINVKVVVRVRETIQSGGVFVTDHDVTLTTEDHRLPSAYFSTSRNVSSAPT